MNLITAYKIHLAPIEDQDEALVHIGEPLILISVAIDQVRLQLLGIEEHARLVGHRVGVHSLIGMHWDYPLVTLALLLEDVSSHITEMQTHIALHSVMALPQHRVKGSPSHLSFSTLKTIAVKVVMMDPRDTEGSSRYPLVTTSSPLGFPTY